MILPILKHKCYNCSAKIGLMPACIFWHFESAETNTSKLYLALETRAPIVWLPCPMDRLIAGACQLSQVSSDLVAVTSLDVYNSSMVVAEVVASSKSGSLFLYKGQQTLILTWDESSLRLTKHLQCPCIH